MNEKMVYIARALDGSWAGVADDLEGAHTLISAKEPDLVRQSDYQILIEPFSKLMANAVPGVRRGLKQTLVKWDGDAPEGGIPEDAATNPTKYSQVLEVAEGGDGIPTRVLYRRD